VFLASDDDGAVAEIGALAENLGFSPIKLGGLRKVDCLRRRAEIAGVIDRCAFEIVITNFVDFAQIR